MRMLNVRTWHRWLLLAAIVTCVGVAIAGYQILAGAVDEVSSYPTRNVPEAFLSSFDARTGEQRWRVKAGGHAVTASIVFADERVVIVENQNCDPVPLDRKGGWLIAFDATSGERRWRKQFAAYFPRLGPGPTVIITTLEAVLGLDPATGKQVWSVDVPLNATIAGTSRQVLVADSTKSQLVSLDRRTGARQWAATLPLGVVERIETNGGAALVHLDRAPRLVVVDAATGVEQFRTDSSESLIAGPTVVAGAGIGGSRGLDAETGAELWQLDDIGLDRAVRATSQEFFAHDRSNLLSVDPASGTVQWGFPARDDRNRFVAATDETVVVAEDSHRITAVDAADGSVLWRRELVKPGGLSIVTSASVATPTRVVATSGCDPSAP